MKYDFIVDENKKVKAIFTPLEQKDISIETDKEFTYDMVDYISIVDGNIIFDEESYNKDKEKKSEEKKQSELLKNQTNKFAARFVDNNEDSDAFADRIDAQVLYTALLTDSIIDPEGEE